MKDAIRLLIYLALVVLLGALAAPPLFWLGQLLVRHDVWPGLARFDFETYFHRALSIVALVLLWPLWRALGLRQWSDLGLQKNPRPFADLLAGLTIAAVPLLLCGAVLLAFHVYSLRPLFLWHKMPGVILAAVFVPIIEEILFRGFILGALIRRASRAGAVLFTSALFSIIHFLKSPTLTPPNESIRWYSGFISIAHSFGQFTQPLLIVGGFLTLFVVGWILADARLQTRSLWLPIGLHAGWILASSVFNKAAHRELLALPWLGKDLLTGILPLSIALVSWALMRAWVNHAGTRTPQSAQWPR